MAVDFRIALLGVPRIKPPAASAAPCQSRASLLTRASSRYASSIFGIAFYGTSKRSELPWAGATAHGRIRAHTNRGANPGAALTTVRSWRSAWVHWRLRAARAAPSHAVLASNRHAGLLEENGVIGVHASLAAWRRHERRQVRITEPVNDEISMTLDSYPSRMGLQHARSSLRGSMSMVSRNMPLRSATATWRDPVWQSRSMPATFVWKASRLPTAPCREPGRSQRAWAARAGSRPLGGSPTAWHGAFLVEMTLLLIIKQNASPAAGFGMCCSVKILCHLHPCFN